MSAITIALVVLLATIVIVTMTRTPLSKAWPIRAKSPLTRREQPMYFRLRETFPEEIVLAQVAFSALLDTRGRATRNRFDRKVADFVLCSRAFEVIAVIELDDSSHATKQASDSKRDAMLHKAGYRVIRFNAVPDADALRAAVRPSHPERPAL